MSIEQHIITATIAGVKELYNQDLPESQVAVQDTRAEFEGQITIVVFPEQTSANTWWSISKK
jgi:arginyl-tRNA synthetase